MSSSAFTLSRLTTKEARRVARKKKPLANAASNSQATVIKEPRLDDKSPSPTQKKRPRKDVVARLTASAKKRSRGAVILPLPSFKPIHKITSTRLGELEKAFFDEPSDNDDQTSEACFDVEARSKVDDDTLASRYSEVTESVDSDNEDDLYLSKKRSCEPSESVKETNSSKVNQNPMPCIHQMNDETTTITETVASSVHQNISSSFHTKMAEEERKEKSTIQNVPGTAKNRRTELVAPADPGALEKSACFSLSSNDVSNAAETRVLTQLKHVGIVGDFHGEQSSNAQMLTKETEKQNVAAWDAMSRTTKSSMHQTQLLSKEPIQHVQRIAEPAELPKPKDKHIGPQKQEASDKVEACLTNDDAQKSLTTEQSNTQSKPNAKHGRPRKTQPPRKKAFVKSSQVDTANKESTKACAPPKAKRRAGKSCCALCKTCPCQKTQTSETVALLDVNFLYRSSIAMEKALIQRLQKLEKSTESLEEQTEMVRRKLKAHRRELWRKSKQDADKNVPKTTDIKNPQESKLDPESFFLPDAEIFEQQQTTNEALKDEEIRKAQLRLFRKIPLKQATLAEMLGFTTGKSPESTDMANSEEVSAEEKVQNTSDEPEIFHIEKPKEGLHNSHNEDLQSEYVKETEYVDKSIRVHRNFSHDSTRIESNECHSLWDLVTQEPQKKGDHEAMHVNVTSKWDAMFAAQEAEDEGLDDLLHLFADNTSVDCSRLPSSALDTGTDEVSISMLSQDAQTIAKGIISNVGSKSVMLDCACPKWKENVAFALKQEDSQAIDQALVNVRHSRLRMLEMKKEILTAWERQNSALEVFESALEASARRLTLKNDGTEEEEELWAKPHSSRATQQGSPLSAPVAEEGL
jgi:hypothetical protein